MDKEAMRKRYREFADAPTGASETIDDAMFRAFQAGYQAALSSAQSEIETALKETIDYKAISNYLYQILDDIDTAGDAAKSNDAFYRSAVERLQSKKSAVVQNCDGYTITFKNPDMKS